MRLPCLLGFVLFAVPLFAAPGMPVPAVVSRYVDEAFAANLALQRQKLDADTARARLAAARALYFPQLDFAARYTVADGGRTIDIPVGDLLNPAYRTLNELLGSAQFPQVPNQSIAFLRGHEQETKLRLLQPLYQPQIKHGTTAARAGVAGAQAALAAFKRELRLDVQRSYFRWLQAEAAVRVYDAAHEVVEEAWRTARVLVATDVATEDAALRAEAEVMSVRQQRLAAAADRDLARAYLNFLLNRAPTTDIERVSDAELETLTAVLVVPDPAAPSATGQREELAAVEQGVRAATAAEQAARAARQPSLALAVEAGIQGENYRFGRGSNFSQASVVADWSLFDGRRIASQVREAGNERAKAAAQRDEVQRQLALQADDAGRRLAAASAALVAARARSSAAERVFDLVSRRQREGLVNQLGFLDARREHTAAQLGCAIARSQLFVAAVEYDRALALTPVP
ncbi:MAG: TolC family protein [Opitutae bacterium]|nr:TolC family protein [Opitutae bacterium]